MPKLITGEWRVSRSDPGRRRVAHCVREVGTVEARTWCSKWIGFDARPATTADLCCRRCSERSR